MADITKCSGNKDSIDCTKRETCYRFTAKPCQYRQSYFVEAPFRVVEMYVTDIQDTYNKIECDSYWEH